MSASARRLRIAVLISGGGTTLRNLIDKIAAGTLPVEIALVISSHPQAGGLRIAAEAGIPTLVVEKPLSAIAGSTGAPQRRQETATEEPTAGTTTVAEAFRDAVFRPCRNAGVQLVVMGGFLKHLLIPADFTHRVVNIHPSLIPAFCGRGYYGLKVHRAVLAAGVKESGCTVHFVDDQYDHGPIILQRRVPVLDGDTPETLAARVFAAECEAYPEALRLIAGGRVQVVDGQVRILEPSRCSGEESGSEGPPARCP